MLSYIPNVYVKQSIGEFVILLLYLGDILLAGNSNGLVLIIK